MEQNHQQEYRVALFGECMIELKGQMFGTMQQNFGGDTLNTAVYLARLCAESNIRVYYATKLGEDDYSEAMIAAWQQDGVDTSLVRREQGRMPGLYTIQVDENGERTFYYWRDSSAAKHYFDKEQSLLEANLDTLDALYFSGISLAVLSPEGRERLLACAEKMRARGGRVFFDNNYRTRLWPDTRQAQTWYERAYAVCDLALITLEDHQALCQIECREKATDHAFMLPPGEVVVKRGASSTLVRLAGQKPIDIPIFKASKVIDTTGAGDSFAAGYLAARLQRQSPEVSARSGNKLASVVIQYPGAIIPRESMPMFFFAGV